MDIEYSRHFPTNGILIISPEGGRPFNQDNLISYQINGNIWEIQSRDTPGDGLQTPGEGLEPVASFIYIPAASPGLSVTPTNNLLTTESGGTASFEVALHSLPTADVIINLASDSAEGVTSVASLTFTPADWNVPQTVTVTGQDDGATDGSVIYNVILSPASSADSGYNGVDPQDVSVINADNEVGITVNAVSVTTTEAADVGTFTIRLNTAPASDVIIGISSTDTSEGTVSTSSLTFTSADWDQAQTVTVTGVDDALDDGNVSYTIITTAAVSADGNYNSFNAADVVALNIDNDTAGVAITPSSGLSVTEAGTTANMGIVLTSEPAANVTVNLFSGDISEGSISPASLTFTPLNWFTSQPATLTGVNDATNDGDISYNITTTVSSSDSLYAALHPGVSAQTLDNEAALTLPSGLLAYGINTPGTSIDAAATVTDSDTANYNSGSLTISLSANGASDDRLEVRNTGTDAGQIGVSGNNVSYEGTTIGSFSGGVGTAPLVVTLNSSATATSVQALLRAVTFRNTNSSPSLALRTLMVALADGQGGISSASKNIQLRLLRVFDFQEGIDNGLGTYTGASDLEMNSVTPGTAYPEGSHAGGLNISVNSIILLRFDNILGNGPAQIPTNAIIVSAELILNVTDTGVGSPLYRMLHDWDGTNTTFFSFSIDGGVTLGSDARDTYDSQWGVVGQTASSAGSISFGVTPDVQAWVNGEANHGWAMPGWQFQNNATVFSPSESTNASARPHLRVKWVPEGTASASFQQGVNGYVGTRDTRIGQDLPETDASTGTSVFVDYEAHSPDEDQVQVLLRFDDIVGNDPGQIPADATVHAAVLQLGSTVNDAPGAGGQFFAMFNEWEHNSTWNSLDNGIFADGIEAANTPSAVAGSLELTPHVQGGYLPFELTADVQDWVNGTKPNRGWAILPWFLGGNGWGFASSDSVVEKDRPQLRVFYSANAVVSPVTMLQPIVTPTSVEIRFSGEIGITYSILRSENIAEGYISIGTATVQPNGIGAFTNNTPLPNTAFYRISNP